MTNYTLLAKIATDAPTSVGSVVGDQIRENSPREIRALRIPYGVVDSWGEHYDILALQDKQIPKVEPSFDLVGTVTNIPALEDMLYDIFKGSRAVREVRIISPTKKKNVRKVYVN